MLSNRKRVYALREWTVEGKNGKWFYWRTYGDKKATKRGPYSSMASVTLCIARELKREIVKRDSLPT